MAGGVYGWLLTFFLLGLRSSNSQRDGWSSNRPQQPRHSNPQTQFLRCRCIDPLVYTNSTMRHPTPCFYTPATDRCEHRSPSLRVYASLPLLSLGLLESIDDLRLDDFPPLNLRYDTSERKNQHPNSRMQQISPFHSSLVEYLPQLHVRFAHTLYSAHILFALPLRCALRSALVPIFLCFPRFNARWIRSLDWI